MTTSLTKEQILNGSTDLTREYVDVPDWGGGVYVRQITASQMDAFIQGMQKSDAKNHRARFVCMVVCDEKGEPLFKKTDAGALGQKSSRAIQRIFDAGWNLNGQTEEEMQELEKNSDEMPEDD